MFLEKRLEYRVKVILRIFRNRYLLNEDQSGALSILAKSGVDITILDPFCISFQFMPMICYVTLCYYLLLSVELLARDLCRYK